MIFIFMYIDEIGKKIFDFLSLILRTIVFALELWQQTVLCRSQSQISYLTYVHLKSSSQLNLCLINNKFNYFKH